MTELFRLIEEIERLKPTTRSMTGEPFANFAPPAKKNSLSEIEEYCGYELPDQFREYLLLHNGQLETTFKHDGNNYQTGLGAIPTIPRLLNCTQILETSKLQASSIPQGSKADELPTRGCLWHPRLLVFSESDGGGYGIDPANGEIFSWDHDGRPVTTIRSDLIAFLKSIIEHMKQLQKN